MALPAYMTTSEKVSYYGVRVFVGAVLIFLVAPILAIMPLSFNSETFFSYPMPGYSTKWYFGEAGFFTNPRWTGALELSVIVAVATTILSTCLGTLAALGLSRSDLTLLTGAGGRSKVVSARGITPEQAAHRLGVGG